MTPVCTALAAKSKSRPTTATIRCCGTARCAFPRIGVFLQHADGTPFFWLGDTWWMGLCHRLHFPDEFATLAADRVQKGFNVVQIVAGLYPDMPPFDERGANENGFPWESEYSRINPAYFDAVDKRLFHLVEQGLMPCIVGAWGYFIKFMGAEKARQHWRNLVARYGALPVVWCVAGEANMSYYRAENFPSDDREQVKEWTQVAKYLRSTDPFHRLITIHPTGIGRLSARNAIGDVSLLDIDMLQTPHAGREAVPPTVNTMRECYADAPVLPIINGEPSYEMLLDSIPARWPRRMFWLCLMNGAAGHTYGANGIWQVNRKGQPHGPSPTEGSPAVGYGVTPWNEAMHFAGSQQVSFGKKLLESFAWQNFAPHPEWARFVDAVASGNETPTENDVFGPQSAGIDGQVRVIYVPENAAIEVCFLEPNAVYSARYFDPTSGQSSDAPQVEVGESGSWICPPLSAAQDEDWVLIVESKS